MLLLHKGSLITEMTDDYKYQGKRRDMIEELRAKGVGTEPVLKAMAKVPRHLFFNQSDSAINQSFAYMDKAFPIAAGQTISQPSTVAFQSSLLEIVKGEKVLEIGTGSGYQTAVLCELEAKVYSIERQKALFDKTKLLLPQLGYQARLSYGDGYAGLPAFAPFDKIIVTAGAPDVPELLLKQLKVGGKMVIPLGEGEKQNMFLIKKISENEFDKIKYHEFRFVPMLAKRANKN